jgi:ABC-type Fe3+/spermidine/putrescine transport system ATPase subunit
LLLRHLDFLLAIVIKLIQLVSIGNLLSSRSKLKGLVLAYLVAQEIKMHFGAFRALDGVSFKAEKGEFITLLGPSGCGKTTLLNIVAGFLKPTGGKLHLGGVDLGSVSPERRDSAMCFQSYALFPHLTVRQNIAFGPRQKRVKKDETIEGVEKLLSQLKLDRHSDKLPNALSGGQQQRVALARALAVKPGLVLFDEPLSNLDAKLREQVRTEIRALQRQVGFTALYVTHDQTEALAMSDRVLLMNNGRVEQEGAPREIYFKPRTRFAADFIGAANLHSGIAFNGEIDTPFGSIKAANLPDGDATLVWRPEMARMGSGERNVLKGKVSSLAFQGAYSDVFVTAGRETLRLQIPGSVGIEIGSDITFHILPENVIPVSNGVP